MAVLVAGSIRETLKPCRTRTAPPPTTISPATPDSACARNGTVAMIPFVRASMRTIESVRSFSTQTDPLPAAMSNGSIPRSILARTFLVLGSIRTSVSPGMPTQTAPSPIAIAAGVAPTGTSPTTETVRESIATTESPTSATGFAPSVDAARSDKTAATPTTSASAVPDRPSRLRRRRQRTPQRSRRSRTCSAPRRSSSRRRRRLRSSAAAAQDGSPGAISAPDFKRLFRSRPAGFGPRSRPARRSSGYRTRLPRSSSRRAG